jgi:hypothetical protein
MFAVLLSGCSGLMTEGARVTPTGHVYCRSSYVPAGIDSAVAIAGASMIAAGASYDRPPDSDLDDGEAIARSVIIAGTATLIAFGVSALHGYSTTAACRREEATQQLDELTRDEP